MMKKLKYFLLIMLATFMSVSSVNAEVRFNDQTIKFINRTYYDFPFTTRFNVGENTSYIDNYVLLDDKNFEDFNGEDDLPKYLYLVYCGTTSINFETTSVSIGRVSNNGSVKGTSCEVIHNGNYYRGNYYLNRWYLDFDFVQDTLYGIKWNIKIHNTSNSIYYLRAESMFLSNELIQDFSSDYLLNELLAQNSNLRSELNDVKTNTSETNNKLDETNQELGDLNNSMTSESEDFDDSSCGVICKLGKIPSKIINGIINGIKSLFIPEDGYFENWFNDLKLFFEEKLGFLAAPFTIFIDFVNMYLNLDSNTDVVINIPDIYVPNFEEYKIISATTFNWSELLKSKESLNTLWQLYLAFVDVFLILNFINLCESKYNRIFGGDTSNYEYYTVEDSITYDNDTGEVTGRRMNERRTTRKKV